MALAPVPSPHSRVHRLVPVGLILLSVIPIVSGSLRLTQLGGGPALIAPEARFSGSPIPVVLHIVSATVFSLAGAFQFLPGLRRGRRGWHSMAGRVLVPAGFVVAASGLWMAVIHPHPAGDGPALMAIRIVFGTYMLTCLVLAVRALTRRSYAAHGAWMTRAYGLGIAAGTQAIALIPGSVLFGSHNEISRAVAMGGAWVLNLAVAELVIRRRTARAGSNRLMANASRTHSIPTPTGSSR